MLIVFWLYAISEIIVIYFCCQHVVDKIKVKENPTQLPGWSLKLTRRKTIQIGEYSGKKFGCVQVRNDLPRVEVKRPLVCINWLLFGKSFPLINLVFGVCEFSCLIADEAGK